MVKLERPYRSLSESGCSTGTNVSGRGGAVFFFTAAESIDSTVSPTTLSPTTPGTTCEGGIPTLVQYDVLQKYHTLNPSSFPRQTQVKFLEAVKAAKKHTRAKKQDSSDGSLETLGPFVQSDKRTYVHTGMLSGKTSLTFLPSPSGEDMS